MLWCWAAAGWAASGGGCQLPALLFTLPHPASCWEPANVAQHWVRCIQCHVHACHSPAPLCCLLQVSAGRHWDGLCERLLCAAPAMPGAGGEAGARGGEAAADLTGCTVNTFFICRPPVFHVAANRCICLDGRVFTQTVRHEKGRTGLKTQANWAGEVGSRPPLGDPGIHTQGQRDFTTSRVGRQLARSWQTWNTTAGARPGARACMHVPISLAHLHASTELRYTCCRAARRPGAGGSETGQREASGVWQLLTSAGCCC